MKIRLFSLSDYEEVVDMLYNFYLEVYPDRKIGFKYAYYEKVSNWINTNKDIVVCLKDDKIVGFTMCYFDTNDGLTEPIYQCEIAYVKPEYRKTRAAYMLYNNAVKLAEENKIMIVSNSRVENGVSDMVQKHFGCEPKFIVNERKYNGK